MMSWSSRVIRGWRSPLHAAGVALVLWIGLAATGIRPPLLAAWQQQTREPTFRAGVEYVQVDARILDKNGEFVPDLVKEDFDVREDGKSQEIVSFLLRTAPRPAPRTFPAAPGASAFAPEPDVRSNEPFHGGVYLLVLDDLHTDPLRSEQARRIAREFVEKHVGAEDMAAVVVTSGRHEANQELTNNRQLILRAIDAFRGSKIRSSTLEKLDEYNRQRNANTLYKDETSVPRMTDDLDFERERDAGAALDALSRVASWMSRMTGGRKALVFVSEGFDYDVFDLWQSQQIDTMMSRGAGTLMLKIRDVINAAGRANVNIYAVDPRGLVTAGQELMEVSNVPEDTRLKLGAQSLVSERQRAIESLQALSDETGGFAIVDSNAFDSGLERIALANTSYYLLGYYPGNRNEDGRYRKIEVLVKRPGVRVIARKGYFLTGKNKTNEPQPAVRSNLSAEVREALNSPLPLTGMRLAAFVAPFRGKAAAGKAARGKADKAANESLMVVVQIDGQAFAESAARQTLRDRMELSLVVVDAEGMIRGGGRHVVDLNVRPEMLQTVLDQGVRFVTRLDVAAGRYQVTVVSRLAGSDRVGSVRYDVEVPDFSTLQVSLSGIVLASASAAKIQTPLYDNTFQQTLPLPPTTDRVFNTTDRLLALVEVYTRPGSSAPVETSTSIYGPDGRIVEETKAVKTAEELKGQGAVHSVQFPLEGLAPGSYRVRIQARVPGAEAVSREVTFTLKK